MAMTLPREEVILSLDADRQLGTMWINTTVVVIEERDDEIKIKYPKWDDKHAFWVSDSVLSK